MNLVFDLDGTVIDSRLRLYTLFQRLAPDSALSFDEYWALKRAKVSNQSILGERLDYPTDAIERFVADWMLQIETPALLGLDSPVPGIDEALVRLGRRSSLYLCTARQDSDAVGVQLEELGLLHHFTRVLVTGRTTDKRALLSGIDGLGQDDWMIGDTGRDIETGRALQLRTCAVLTGFLSEHSLRPYGPDLLLASAADFRLP